MKYSLPELPYPYDALEPHFDKRTMILHYTSHHQAYIDKLNSILAGSPQSEKTAPELLKSLDTVPASIRSEVENNAGGHANHSFFWPSLSPHSEKKPTGHLLNAIEAAFGSTTNLMDKFSARAASHFASGWVWVCLDRESKMILTATSDQDSPLSSGYVPLLVLDLWEHAYYLKYQNRRKEYIDAFWKVVNWTEMGNRLENAGV